MFEDVRAAADQLAEALSRVIASSLDDDVSLVEALRTVTTARAVADGAMTQVTAEAERLGTPGRLGMSLRELLMRNGSAPSVASRSIRLARAAVHMPALTRHLTQGSLSAEMCDAIARGVAHVTTRTHTPLGSELADETEVALIGHAIAGRTPVEIADRAREIALATSAQRHDPRDDRDVADHPPAEQDSTLNEVSWSQAGDGRLSGAFDLDVVTGERFIACLDAASRPRPLPDGTPDPRSVSRRRADAFAQVLESASRALAVDGLVSASKTDVVVTIPTGPTPIRDRVPRMQWLGSVSGVALSLVACDAAVTRIGLDADGAPVTISSPKRLFTGRVRKAVIVRDECCVKCGAPASWTDVHHIVEHSAGGPTTCDNGCLLCRTCHVAVHQHGWEIVLGPDRHPWVRPPASVDRRREPQPAYNRRTLRLDGAA